jgi:hypothetical protein
MKYCNFLSTVVVLSLNLFLSVFFPTTINAAEEVGRTTHHVWSGFWWQTKNGSIQIPLAKYGKLTVSWEKANRPANPSLPTWDGLCHGWPASAVLEIEPRKTIQNTLATLYVGDQKGWFAVAHADDVANFYGDRYGDGIGSEAPQVLTPDMVWQILRRYIKEQKTPLVFDIDAGEAIWNYPCYAYRVKHQPTNSEDNIHKGTLELWFADNNVSQNFVGLKEIYQKYDFQVEMVDNSIVMGTGQWLGDSVTNHPDFAWFPYVVRSGNPEVKYETVCKLLGRQTTIPPRPINIDNPVTTPTTPNTPLPEMLSENMLTLPELFALLEGKSSSWDFDIRCESFDGKYTEGELLTIKGISAKSGYLYLFGISPDSELAVLYPQSVDNNKIEAKKEFSIPSQDSPYNWKITIPAGAQYTIRGIVTENPMYFSGKYVAQQQIQQQTQQQAQQQQTIPISELRQRVMPTEQQLIQQQRQTQSQELRQSAVSKIESFSQDEVQIFVIPAEKHPLKKPKQNQRQQQIQQQQNLQQQMIQQQNQQRQQQK